jgi:hypothetical protein
MPRWPRPLEHGADPKRITHWRFMALHHNDLKNI